jgi:hypothetical protein
VEARAAIIPTFVERRCIFDCRGVPLYSAEDDTDTVPIGTFSIRPSYRDGRLTWFVGLTWRNHPTDLERTTESAWLFDAPADVNPGPVYRILDAGAEYQASATVALVIQIFQPLDRSVVDYGPALGLALACEPREPVRSP